MFLRRPVPIHLKSVVAYRKNLDKCQVFWAQSIAASLIGLEGSGHMQGHMQATHHPLKCPGMHCSYSCC